MFLYLYREQLLEALLEASRHLLVPDMSHNKAFLVARQVAGSLLQVGVLYSCASGDYIYVLPLQVAKIECKLCDGDRLLEIFLTITVSEDFRGP